MSTNEAPLWLAATRLFIQPTTIEANAKFTSEGPPGIGWQPANDAAQAIWDKWAEANPQKVGHRPFDELALTQTEATIVAPPPKEEEIEHAPQLGAPQKAQPGLSDGGKAKPVAKAS